MQRVHDATAVYGSQPPNHVLINAYQPGEGIMPHEDGPAYHPGVCIVSLGAPAVLRFRRKRRAGEDGQTPATAASEQQQVQAQAPELSVVLMPRSLVVFTEQAYTDCLHGLDEAHAEQLDRSVANLAMYGLAEGSTLPRGGERVSLTIRRVDKVVRGFMLGKR